MDSSRLAEALSAAVKPSARIYLLPCGLGALSGMAPMVATGTAMPLAGGPLAFTACEIAVRGPGGVQRATATLVVTRVWAAGLGADSEVSRQRPARPSLGDAPRPARRAALGPASWASSTPRPTASPTAASISTRPRPIAHGQRLAHAGADILDIGGESTRPGAAPVAPQRGGGARMPVLQGLAQLRASFPQLLPVHRYPPRRRHAGGACARRRPHQRRHRAHRRSRQPGRRRQAATPSWPSCTCRASPRP